MNANVERAPGLVADLLARGAPTTTVFLAARGIGSLTRADLRDALDAWRAALDRAGVPAGGRVAIVVDDPLVLAAVHLAVMGAGRCSVPLDPGAPGPELRRALRRCGAGVLVADDDAAARVPELPRARPDRRGLPGAVPASCGTLVPGGPVTPLGDGAATLLSTSGSTGEPKGVLLDEERLVHVARAVAEHLELTPDDRGLTPLPLFHVNAQVIGLLATLVAGSSLVLDRRFRRSDFWACARAHDVTWINVVPAILTVLAREEDPPLVPPRLRLVRSASAPLPVAVRDAVQALTGVPVLESYGMTEAASQITAVPLHEVCPDGSVGRPAGADVAVRRPNGAAAAAGERGRVWIRGAGVVTGYEGGRSAERFDDDGWLDSGDVGHLDDAGFLHLAGRDDDVINRGGELLHPREVEEVLLSDPRVAEAVVVGLPHEVLGAVPVACVRTIGGPSEEDMAADLDARCRSQLARWKCPVQVVVLDDLPRGSTGKVRRADVRELVSPAS
ncbi:AMP-binding protein [Actinomycetospora endophytica]|uniref:AMP-binding protein n=1 Tax=Actinomycetospora endophytica TaxID=2291215 RepID=A0ABS8PCH2_9PSEU|nr:AMP-binding protein [Actinomycetospora endophytica]MCD2195985.1 AMP-binding protein [Actinomycetospora endophytica]